MNSCPMIAVELIDMLLCGVPRRGVEDSAKSTYAQ